MGVKLTSIVTKKQLDFKDLANKKIVIDFSNSAYQFLSSIRQQDGTPLTDSKGNITSVYLGIWSRFTKLMQNNIKLAVVFDGKPPKLKEKEKERRSSLKQQAMEKLEKAETDEEKLKFAKRTGRLTQEIIDGSKELIKAMGIPIIQAPSEADAQMAFMAEQKDVWATASSDIDCLIYGTPRLITNLTLSQRRRLPSGNYIKTYPEMIILKDLLNEFQITRDQLLIMAILIGTDYNTGVKGIGPKTALKLVKQYKDYDELFKQVKPDFNWKEIYAVFKSMPIMKNYQLKWGPPNKEKIKQLLVDKHEFSEERVDKTLKALNKKQKGLTKWF